MAQAIHGQRHQHHRRHHDNIPRDYTDLTAADIAVLTKILSHAPKQRNSSRIKPYERIVREQTSNLSSHLRARLPWVSSFCFLHNRINPFPVNSILEWLKEEVDRYVPEVWSALEQQNLLDASQSKMLTLVKAIRSLWNAPERHKHKKSSSSKVSVAYGYGSNKCSACILADIGGNEQLLTALGAFFIGRVHSSIWKRSKRVAWLESWVRGAVEDREEDKAIHNMWQLGMALRELRKKAEIRDRVCADEFVEKARAADQDHSRKQIAQQDPNEPDRGQDEWLAHATADELFADEDTWQQLQPSKDPEQEPGFEREAGEVEDGLNASQLFHVPSSIYSQDSVWSQPSSHDTESELIDLYRHTMWSETPAGEDVGSVRDLDAVKDHALMGECRNGLKPMTKPRGNFF